jgi:hypothetical protein
MDSICLIQCRAKWHVVALSNPLFKKTVHNSDSHQQIQSLFKQIKRKPFFRKSGFDGHYVLGNVINEESKQINREVKPGSLSANSQTRAQGKQAKKLFRLKSVPSQEIHH